MACAGSVRCNVESCVHSHTRVMHACMKRNRGRIRCIFARYEEYAACMCVHDGGAHMPASNRAASLRAHSENVKRGFAGRSLRIWLKILRRNAWLILYHRTKSPNSREVPSDAAGRPPWRGHVRFKQDQRFSVVCICSASKQGYVALVKKE